MVTNRGGLLLALTAVSVAAALLLPSTPQPVAYHDFADHRSWFGIGNFLDVASNAGFAIGGIAGLAITFRRRTGFELDAERWPYALFFAGMLGTALGSAHYHLLPDNERLFWDRLPMTVAFMSLIAAQIVDRMSIRAGLFLLLPLLGIGAVSVYHWRATERAGEGNLLPYAILQGYSVVVLLIFAAWHPSRYTRGNDVYGIFAAYVIAKVLEHFDREVLGLGGVVSGHTLKHVAAAIAGLLVARMLFLRRPLARREHGAQRSLRRVA